MVRRPAAAGPARGDIWLAALDPTVGAEIPQGTALRHRFATGNARSSANRAGGADDDGQPPAPFRIPVRFEDKAGLILLDQIRALDRQRLLKRLGALDARTLRTTLARLQDIFAE